MHFGIYLAVAALALPAYANPVVTHPASQTQEVLRKIHLTNKLEIKLGHLAQDRANSEGLRKFGKRLVVDHEAADKKLAEVAKKENIIATNPIPAVDDAVQKQEDAIMKNLDGKKGNDFDHAFAAELDKGHHETIASLKVAQEQLKGSATAGLIAELLPTLHSHKDAAGKQFQKTK